MIEAEWDMGSCRNRGLSHVSLNTLEEEMKGETEFLLLERKIRPVAGKLLIYPAGYPFVHRGNKPCSSDKYVLISWLEYV